MIGILFSIEPIKKRLDKYHAILIPQLDPTIQLLLLPEPGKIRKAKLIANLNNIPHLLIFGKLLAMLFDQSLPDPHGKAQDLDKLFPDKPALKLSQIQDQSLVAGQVEQVLLVVVLALDGPVLGPLVELVEGVVWVGVGVVFDSA
jgi:hypothetical protein